MFQALALCRSNEGLRLETSVLESLYGGQLHLFMNPVDTTKIIIFTWGWPAPNDGLFTCILPTFVCIGFYT